MFKKSIAIYEKLTAWKFSSCRLLFQQLREHAILSASRFALCVVVLLCTCSAVPVAAQVDQGTITGVVQDSSGAVIPGADVTLISLDTDFVRQTKSNASGIFVFTPIKIGHYSVSAVAPNFEKTVQENLQLNIGERLNVPMVLKPGEVAETVTVNSAPPLLQSETADVSQVMSSHTINSTPLAERNWVYMAQLSSGVVPSYGTRGGSHGDYQANGQRAEQNNYVLDGVDNNVNIVDYMNGYMIAVVPPPDAVSEFKLQTADYSAEFGHSAGSTLNVAIKSGTNQIHGDIWEFVRNTALNAQNWNATSIPPYHFNQFGGTLGLPILRNRLFYFGDIQDTRISYSSPNTYSVPTPLERQGNFSELLHPSLTGGSCPVYLYQPNSNTGAYSSGTCNTVPATGTLLNSNGQQNVLSSGQIDPVAQNILNLYPLPNANGWNSSNNANTSTVQGKTYNNLVENLAMNSDPVQWDQRLDWNISQRDQAYTRASYFHIVNGLQPPLGPILDGTTNFAGTKETYLSENYMLSETHDFSPTLINEFRFSYNWGSYANLQANYNVNEAANLGLGGMPFGPGYFDNGGLPSVSVSSIQAFGSHGNDPSVEGQNVYEVLDNVTKILGNHSLKMGAAWFNMRILFLQPPVPRGSYSYTGAYTGVSGVTNTGNGIADFLIDQMNGAQITTEPKINDQNLYNSAYIEDSWRVNPRLTLTYGLRYDYFQPYREMANMMANFVPLTQGIGTGTGTYSVPNSWQSVQNWISPVFTSLLAQDNIQLLFASNPRLTPGQKNNFAPRIGLSYQIEPKTVVRLGYGIFFGALQSGGSSPNISENYPFVPHSALSAVGCKNGSTCPSLSGPNSQAVNYTGAPDATLENGLSNQIASGIINFISNPVINGRDARIRTPYTMNFNLSIEHSFGGNLAATVAYVGNVSRHLETLISSDPAQGLLHSGLSSQFIQAFPQFGNSVILNYGAESNYNSLQAKLEKRYTNGLSFLASYTWAHALDDSVDPLGGGASYRDTALIPIADEYTNSNYDVRQRITFNGTYDLPFGRGRVFLNKSRFMDEIVGGWSTSLTFTAQTGLPFTIGTSNVSIAAGGSAHAITVGNPFKGGGNPDPSNPSLSCPARVKTLANWYNPCAFANPETGNDIPNTGSTLATATVVTGTQNAINFLGGRSNTIAGPGFERVNMSLFKNFATLREQYLQFRADAFNVFNHPSWANPSNTGLTNTGGQITSPLTLQANVPDARIFQLSAKYVF